MSMIRFIRGIRFNSALLFQRLALFLAHDGQPFLDGNHNRNAETEDGHTQAVDKFLFGFLVGFAVHGERLPFSTFSTFIVCRMRVKIQPLKPLRSCLEELFENHHAFLMYFSAFAKQV